MSNEMIFRLLTGALFVTVLAISIYFRHRAERQGGQLNQREGQRLLVPLRLLGLVGLLPFIGYLVNPDWASWARFDLPAWPRWGAALVACSWPQAWSPTPRPPPSPLPMATSARFLCPAPT